MSAKDATARPWRLATKGNFGNIIEGPTGKTNFEGDDGYRSVATYQAATASTLYAEERVNAAANGALIVQAVNAYADLVEALQRYIAAYPAFRMKPVGAPGSQARVEQENLMALEDAANSALKKARGE